MVELLVAYLLFSESKVKAKIMSMKWSMPKQKGWFPHLLVGKPPYAWEKWMFTPQMLSSEQLFTRLMEHQTQE